MISKQVKGGSSKVDDTLVLTVLAGATLAILLWICIAVSDIQTNMEETHNTLDIIEKTFEQHSVLLDKINKQLKEICHLGQQQIECP